MGKPLLAVIRDLALDPAEKAAFESAPADYLGRHGHEGVTPDDLREAVSLAADTMDPQVAQAIAPPEGGDADVLETLQRVTNAAPPAGPDEAQEGAEASTEAGSPDLAFGSGSSVESGLDDPGTDAVDAADMMDTGETLPAEDDSEGLDFDAPVIEDSLPEDELVFDEGEVQAADDFADHLQDTEIDLHDDSVPDVGAF